MSSRLACDLSDVIAAVGPVGGVRFPEACSPGRAVPLIAVHSEDDEVNHFEHRNDSPPYWPVGVNDAISSWTKNNGCAVMPKDHAVSTGIVEVEFEQCRAGGDVVLYRLKEGGHRWPGSPTATNHFGATEHVWAFFERHPRR